MVEKSIAADGVNEFVGLAMPGGEKNGADVVGLKTFFAAFRVDGGEAGEIMLALDEGGGGDHLRFVEWIGVMIDITGLEWRTNCSTKDVVAVSLGDGRVSGMEAGRRFLNV